MSAFDAAHSHENFYSNLVKKYTDLIILNLKYIQQILKKRIKYLKLLLFKK